MCHNDNANEGKEFIKRENICGQCIFQSEAHTTYTHTDTHYQSIHKYDERLRKIFDPFS